MTEGDATPSLVPLLPVAIQVERGLTEISDSCGTWIGTEDKLIKGGRHFWARAGESLNKYSIMTRAASLIVPYTMPAFSFTCISWAFLMHVLSLPCNLWWGVPVFFSIIGIFNMLILIPPCYHSTRVFMSTEQIIRYPLICSLNHSFSTLDSQRLIW